MSNEVSIVVPNWNGAALLRKHLPSVLQAASASRAEVIVVDDGSSDESLAVLKRDFAGVRCLTHDENRGFGAAVWTGVRAARGARVALLNTDVSVPEGFLAPLLEHFSSPDVFAVSPRVLDEKGVPVSPSVMLPAWRRGFLRFDKPPRNGELSAPRPTFFVSGGSSVIDRQKFVKLGGFDPLFAPFYSEDVDLCWRAWRRGWRSIFEPRSAVTHAHAGTISSHFERRRVKAVKIRNRYLLIWANAEWRSILRHHALQTILRIPLRTIACDRAQLLGLVRALGRVGTVRRARRQRSGGLSWTEILRLIEDPGGEG